MSATATRYRIDSFELTRDRPGYREQVGVAALWRRAHGAYDWTLDDVALFEAPQLVMAQAANPELVATCATMAHDEMTRRLADRLNGDSVADRLAAPWPVVVYTDQSLYGTPEWERFTTMQGVRELTMALLRWRERNGGETLDSTTVYSLLLGLWQDLLLELLDEYVQWCKEA